MDRLLREKNGEYYSKDLRLLDLKKLENLGPKTFQILREISERKLYPKKIAEELRMHEQKVYYHVKKLEKAGLIEVYKRERSGGALCKFYRPSAKSFGFDLTDSWNKIGTKNLDVSEEVLNFFSEFIEDGIFNGSMVVGSPKQHGPFMTSARDGHYAVQLGIFLGRFCNLEERFVVKLDTEVKAENAVNRNLMLVGGPITNTVSRDINENLEVRFDWEEAWKIISKKTKKEYIGENLGLIAKIRENDYSRILLSGLDSKGTKTCIIALTQKFDEILEKYDPDDEFYRVIKGLDRDGDGKTDDVEVLE